MPARWRYVVAGAATAVLLAVGARIGVGSAQGHRAGGPPAVAARARRPKPRPKPKPSRPPEAASESAPVLSAGANVRFVLSYPSCGITRQGSGPLPPGLVGATRQAAATALAPYVVRSFSPDLLVVGRELPGCPAGTVTLVARDGQVMVLEGPPGDAGGTVRNTGIPLRGLAPEERRRVEAGWAVPAAELPATLRSLTAGH